MAFFAQVPPSPGSRLAEQLGLSVGQGIEKRMLQGQQKQQQGILAKLLQGGQLSDQEMQMLPMDAQVQVAQLQQKQQAQQEKNKLLQLLLGQVPQEEGKQAQQDPGIQGSPQSTSSSAIRQLGDNQLAALSLVDPQTARLIQGMQKERNKGFQQERAYHTGFTKELEKKAENLRESIPRKENALDLARDAVTSGDLGRFSKDRIADAIGGPIGDALRTAKGAQLITAGKENLLNNMSKVSAKAQNIWFEQRLNSMFSKIGQSQEANLTVQEMLEGEVAMDKAYLDAFEKLSSEDEKFHGYTRKDIGKRTQDAVKPFYKQIFDRSSYRIKEIEEKEKGISALKEEVGKKVLKGTPLTLAMAKLYKDKFGDQALKVAQENGYTIPTIEEFSMYKESPRKYRESLAQ